MAGSGDDLEQLIAHITARHTTAGDYGDISHKEFVVRMVALESWARQIVIEVTDQGESDWLDVYGRAARIAYKLVDVNTLRQLRGKGAGDDVLVRLVQLGLELRCVYAELTRRLEAAPVGRAMLRIGANTTADGPEEALVPVLEAIRAEALTSYRPHKESDDDLRAEAVAAAWEKLKEEGDEVEKGLTLPDRIEFRRPGLPESTVRWPWEELRAAEIREGLKLLLPVLTGAMESLSATVHQSLRDHFDKWKAAKRTGIEIAADDECEEERADEPVDLALRVDADTAYREASNRWGERGRRFIGALFARETVVDAAKAAGISRKTGYKYLEILRSVLKEKK